MESILDSVKAMLGITPEQTHFDQDIIMHINSVFVILQQIGVGPKEGFTITDSSATWDEYITEDDDLDAVKTYMYLKVKLLFDPPLSSSVLEANKQLINELEWRLNVQVKEEV